jgi:uncharacterized protein YndB with AHSA1/START domain
MAFPDRIERTVELAHPVPRVWAALTTADALGAWLGKEATIDLGPGGAGRITFATGLSVDMRVELVEEPHVFGFTWRIPELPDDDPRRTYVEFTLAPVSGGTRLRVVETGFAQLPDGTRRPAYDGHAQGWAMKVGELARYLDAI